jgi:NAD(P)-dependent dehydrogenase (short-subunit alcohol dehydrogenase family)
VLKLAGRTAIVTGAAGGIGRGIALALARRGCHLALADIDEAALSQTAAEMEARNTATRPRVSRHRFDVASRPAVAALPAQVMEAHGAVDLLVKMPAWHWAARSAKLPKAISTGSSASISGAWCR